MSSRSSSRRFAALTILLLGPAIILRPVFAAPVAQTAGSAPVPHAMTSPAIEPQVAAVLSPACALLSSNQLLSYHAKINFDSVLPSLIKLQYAARMEVAIKRPDRLAIDYQSDLGAKRIWDDGDTLTIFDPAHIAYASLAVPDSIDAMLAEVAEEKNLTIPLSGFDVSNPCQRIRRSVIHSKYIGINVAGGVECDHLAFTQKEADWQLWIERGKKPLPRKIVITYKNLSTQPQWEAIFTEWRFDQPLPASTFEPHIPKGAIKTNFIETKGTSK